MPKNIEPVYYGDYLRLDKLLSAQQPHSTKYGPEAHDETLFIIVHQVYELWFKQVLHEFHSVLKLMQGNAVADQDLITIVHRLERVKAIQTLMNDQVGIVETMTPQEFLAFRDYLVPASGFQSIQFKELEIILGLTRQRRIAFDQQSFYNRLEAEDRAYLEDLEQQENLFDRIDAWLARMPYLEFDGFSFWSLYQDAVQQMLDKDAAIIRENQTLTAEEQAQELAGLEATRENFAALFDADKYQEAQQQGRVRLSQDALLSALFISLYREEPVFNLPFQVINALADIDEKLTIWRYKHAMMVQRMIGSKIGTGGSSGHDYLRKTTESNRVFADFFAMATYLIPKAALPVLPEHVKRSMGFWVAGAPEQKS